MLRIVTSDRKKKPVPDDWRRDLMMTSLCRGEGSIHSILLTDLVTLRYLYLLFFIYNAIEGIRVIFGWLVLFILFFRPHSCCQYTYLFVLDLCEGDDYGSLFRGDDLVTDDPVIPGKKLSWCAYWWCCWPSGADRWRWRTLYCPVLSTTGRLRWSIPFLIFLFFIRWEIDVFGIVLMTGDDHSATGIYSFDTLPRWPIIVPIPISVFPVLSCCDSDTFYCPSLHPFLTSVVGGCQYQPFDRYCVPVFCLLILILCVVINIIHWYSYLMWYSDIRRKKGDAYVKPFM